VTNMRKPSICTYRDEGNRRFPGVNWDGQGALRLGELSPENSVVGEE